MIAPLLEDMCVCLGVGWGVEGLSIGYSSKKDDASKPTEKIR